MSPFSPPISILIVGAGELGESILAALATHPSRPAAAKIDVLLRAESIARPATEAKRASNEGLRALGAGLVPGNFVDDEVDALAGIFKGYEVVVQAGGYGLPAGTQERVTEAVLRAGVRRYLWVFSAFLLIDVLCPFVHGPYFCVPSFLSALSRSSAPRHIRPYEANPVCSPPFFLKSPWQFGVDYEAIGPGSALPLFDEMLVVRRTLRAQDRTKWTVVSTGLFMSYLFLRDFGVVDLDDVGPGGEKEKKKKVKVVRALGSWANRVTVTTPRDIGRVTAEMVFVPGEDTLNRVVYVGGETLSYGELAGVLEGVWGEEIEREEWDVGFLRERLGREPQNLWYKYQCIFGGGRGVAWDLEETLNGRRGIKMTTVRDYVVATYTP